jgi:hypothetical protein
MSKNCKLKKKRKKERKRKRKEKKTRSMIIVIKRFDKRLLKENMPILLGLRVLYIARDEECPTLPHYTQIVVIVHGRFDNFCKCKHFEAHVSDL